MGPFTMRFAEQPIEIPSRRARALLAYLIQRRGEAIARTTVTGLLWGERSEEQARASLRQLLSELRTALAGVEPNPLESNKEIIRWNPLCAVTDTDALDAKVMAGTSVSSVDDLPSGDFLEGLEIGEPGFDYWQTAERERLRNRLAELLAVHMTQAEQDGQTENALTTGLKLLALDPLQEEVHRTVMRLYAAQGRSDAALAQYERLKLELKSQLNVEPDSKTQELARSIKSGRKNTQKETIRAVADLADNLSIAVLPFTNLSNDPAQDYFGDGISADIISALSLIRGLLVIARSSSAQFKGRPVSASEVARELNVRYVLEGSVRVAGSRVRVTAQLSDGRNGATLWADRYEKELIDIFAVQDEITQNICLALQIKLTQGESARLWEGQTKNLNAWQKLVEARELFHRFTMEDNSRSSQLLQEALAIDPSYTVAMVHLGIRYYWDARYSPSVNRTEYLRLAEEQADRAEALNPQIGAIYILKAAIALTRDQHEDAIKLAEYGISLMPNDYLGLIYLSQMYLYAGDPQKAADTVKASLRLSPKPINTIHYFVALTQMWIGNLDRAHDAACQYLKLEPEEPYGFVILALILSFQGRTQDAAEVIARLKEIVPNFTIANIISSQRYREKEKLDRVVAALKAAGLS